MKRTLITMLALLSLATTVYADDSIGIGIRGGAAANRSSRYTEAFGDLYINKLVSVGATVGYVMLERGDLSTVRRDESVPIIALFKVHAPIPFFSPYGGFGQGLIFHDSSATTGSPVGFVGGDLGFGPGIPLFLNIEYRRQFKDKLDFLGGGVGIKF